MNVDRRLFRTVALLAIALSAGMSQQANAQHITIGGSRGRTPTRAPLKTVSFDPKSKLEVAYAKIIAGTDQTFEQRLQAAVVMERWENVKKILSELEPTKRRDVSISTLGKAGTKIAVPMGAILSILDNCPGPMTKAQQATFFRIIQKTISSYGGTDLLIKKVNDGLLGIGGEGYQGKKAAFELLMRLELYDEATKFLITTEDAKKAEKDRVVLQHFNALNAKCKKVGRTADYMRLRQIGQWLVERKNIPQSDLIRITTEMTPTLGFIDEQEAIDWFKANFKNGPAVEKKTVLACTDYLMKAQKSKNPALRDAGLRLQKRMVDALIQVHELKDRGPVADILAGYWLEEAKRGEQKVSEFNSHERRYQWQRRYGRTVPPVRYSDAGAPSMEVLRETTPSGVWVEKLRPESFLKLQEYRSNIYVNTSQFDLAIEVVKEVSKIAPGKAAGMAQTVMKKWSAKVNPNAGLSQNRHYAGKRGIPLTRTKQLRNMKQLKKMVGEFRKCLSTELKETILVNAFANAHSAAEVYAYSDIESVLGKPSKLSRHLGFGVEYAHQTQ